jgi:hypothetical protein
LLFCWHKLFSCVYGPWAWTVIHQLKRENRLKKFYSPPPPHPTTTTQFNIPCVSLVQGHQTLVKWTIHVLNYLLTLNYFFYLNESLQCTTTHKIAILSSVNLYHLNQVALLFNIVPSYKIIIKASFYFCEKRRPPLAPLNLSQFYYITLFIHNPIFFLNGCQSENNFIENAYDEHDVLYKPFLFLGTCMSYKPNPKNKLYKAYDQLMHVNIIPFEFNLVVRLGLQT